MATVRKTKPAEAGGKQRNEKVPDRPCPILAADLQDAVTAARSRFLYAAEIILQKRLALAIKAFRQNRFAHAGQVLAPVLDGWQELMILLAKDYFSNKMRVMAEKQASSGALAWANTQTRSALDEAFGTTWFSCPDRKLQAVSCVVNSWLREIDKTLFVPHKPVSGSLPALVDTKAWTTIFLQQVQWRGHGWLATCLHPSTAAFKHYVENPLEPLTDEVQAGVVGDIALSLFEGIERE